MAFDFQDYAYSGLLSLVAALFGIGYPLIISSIERIDNKYHSSMLTARLSREKTLSYFKFLLAINAAYDILLPFLLDQSKHGRFYLSVQASATIFLIASAFCLFRLILNYNNANWLHCQIWDDYIKANARKSRADELRFFTEWVDLSCELIVSADRGAARRVYDNWLQMNNDHIDNIYDQFIYDGLTRLNEKLCQSKHEPISINNRNALITSLIQGNRTISEETYTALWKNLTIQIFYNRDEWLMAYWENASNKFDIYLNHVTGIDFNEETGENYTSDEVSVLNSRRDRFWEFNIFLLAMLLQEKKYSLVRRMLAYTSSQPPSYPLVPTSFDSCLEVLFKINKSDLFDFDKYERRYPMPGLNGISNGKIEGAANMLIALLIYRLYCLPQYPFGVERIFTFPSVTGSLHDLNFYKDCIEIIRYWLLSIEKESEILSVVNFDSWESRNSYFNETYNIKIKKPCQLLDSYLAKTEASEKKQKIKQPYDEKKVKRIKDETVGIILKGMKVYGEFFNSNIFENSKTYLIDAYNYQPFPNEAFVSNPSISYVDIENLVGWNVLYKFYHFFASTFFLNNSQKFTINIQDIFVAFDKLALDSNKHVIVSFDVFWEYFPFSDSFKKENDSVYSYKGIRIINLNCTDRIFSHNLFILPQSEMPNLDFVDPEQGTIDRFGLKQADGLYHIWQGLRKISEYPNMLPEDQKQRIDDNGELHSIYATFMRGKMTWVENPHIQMIKLFHIGADNGNFDSIDSLKPIEF